MPDTPGAQIANGTGGKTVQCGKWPPLMWQTKMKKDKKPSTSISAKEAVRLECANLRSDGSCRGMDWDSLGRASFNGERDNCLVSDGLRCKYFERYVLPLKETVSKYALLGQDYLRHLSPTKYQEVKDADGRQGFLLPMAGNFKATKTRGCPRCGAALLRGKRLCSDCRKTRRREAYRRQKRSERQKVVPCPTEVAKTPVITADVART